MPHPIKFKWIRILRIHFLHRFAPSLSALNNEAIFWGDKNHFFSILPPSIIWRIGRFGKFFISQVTKNYYYALLATGKSYL
jgi:hypothetical protein